MDKWRFEYNEKQGLTNFEDNDKNNANTFGWETICDNLSEVQCLEFCDVLDKEYPNIGGEKPFPRTSVIIEEFELYLKSSPITTQTK